MDPTKLTESETATVAGISASLTASVEEYVRQHPELKDIVQEFIKSVLEAKPKDLQAFAKQHFNAKATSTQ
jgi:hypothetical protein